MRRFLPSLSALQAFEAAASHMSFTRAAEDLGVTQSGISRQIKNLEDYLGMALFERSGPRLVLTESGISYYRDVSQMLDSLQEASIDVVRGRKANTSLLIGAHPTFVSRWLAPRLGSFIRAYPDIPLEITQPPQTADFSSSAVDISILRGINPLVDARSYELYRETLVVVAAPSLIPFGTKLDREKLIEYASSFIMLQNASRPSMWLHWIRSVGIKYVGTITGPRFPNSDMVISAAVAGVGLAIVPLRFVERELSRGELHTPFDNAVPSGDSMFVVYPERKANHKSLITFRDWLMRETRSYRGNEDCVEQ